MGANHDRCYCFNVLRQSAADLMVPAISLGARLSTAAGLHHDLRHHSHLLGVFRGARIPVPHEYQVGKS